MRLVYFTFFFYNYYFFYNYTKEKVKWIVRLYIHFLYPDFIFISHTKFYPFLYQILKIKRIHLLSYSVIEFLSIEVTIILVKIKLISLRLDLVR